jgi:hypothetical protein
LDKFAHAGAKSCCDAGKLMVLGTHDSSPERKHPSVDDIGRNNLAFTMVYFGEGCGGDPFCRTIISIGV